MRPKEGASSRCPVCVLGYAGQQRTIDVEKGRHHWEADVSLVGCWAAESGKKGKTYIYIYIPYSLVLEMMIDFVLVLLLSLFLGVCVLRLLGCFIHLLLLIVYRHLGGAHGASP